MHRDCVLYMYVASVSRRSFGHSHIAGRVRRTQLPNIQLSISYMFAEVQTTTVTSISGTFTVYYTVQYCQRYSTVLITYLNIIQRSIDRRSILTASGDAVAGSRALSR